MVHPCPGARPTATYMQRGRSWSLRRNSAGLGLHTGRDYAAPVGTPIVSATPGRVIAANAYDTSYGYKVIVRWGSRDVWYCHMPRNAARVKVGDTVKAGQRIGAIGDTGNVTGAHLHLELRTAGAGFAYESFHDPIIAVNHAEDWFTMATEAQLRNIIREELAKLFDLDVVPMVEPIRTPEHIERDPTAKVKSVLSSTLQKAYVIENKLDKLMGVAPEPSPDPDPTPTPEPERDTSTWLSGMAWNLAASDTVHGRASWSDRLPGILEALQHYNRDIVLLTEACTKANLSTFDKALNDIGWKVAVYDTGRAVVVRDSVRVGRTLSRTLADRGPSNDDKQVVVAECFPPTTPDTAVLATVGHFDTRTGDAYDKTRAAQVAETRKLAEDTAKAWNIGHSRMVFYCDEPIPSRTEGDDKLVRAAWGPWVDIGAADPSHVPFYTNREYSTKIGWDGKPVKRYRPDKVRVDAGRPLEGASTSLTFAARKLSDHLPVLFTLNRIASES